MGRKKETKKPAARLLGWILGICTILGGLTAVITFIPRVTVTPSDPVDSDNPFSASFTVTNASLVPMTLTHVSVGVSLGQIIAEPLPFNSPKDFGWEPGKFRITTPEWSNHRLEIDESFKITLERMFGMGQQPPYKPSKLSGSDLAIVVNYEPWFLPWQREKAFRFTTHRQSNGVLYWYSTPLK